MPENNSFSLSLIVWQTGVGRSTVLMKERGERGNVCMQNAELARPTTLSCVVDADVSVCKAFHEAYMAATGVCVAVTTTKQPHLSIGAVPASMALPQTKLAIVGVKIPPL